MMKSWNMEQNLLICAKAFVINVHATYIETVPKYFLLYLEKKSCWEYITHCLFSNREGLGTSP